ncbi:MAG TPA: hypothetical protein VGM02_14575 [Acidobacteriaceae bacterium]|jgi:hypothetical protein
MITHLNRRTALLMLGSLAASRTLHAQWDPARRYGPPRASHRLEIGGATLQVDFATGDLDLSDEIIVKRIETAARAVVTYYGRFPVPRARVLIVPMAGRDGVHGTTWGDVGGWPAFTSIRLGQHTSAQELAADWTTTHELVHTAFPSLPDDQHWVEEGLATYIEPVARVQTGELPAKQIWHDMLDGMPKGEPGPGDEGLDRTHTWGRTYWGGALFCLVADVQIRVATGNRKGLEDALRAIVRAGGTIDHEWPLTHALTIGDNATGTQVLSGMYRTWSTSPLQVDLEKLWKQLGVVRTGQEIEFNASASYAKIREAITTAKS